MTSTTDVIKQHTLKITDQRGVTLQTTWIANNTAVRTSYRSRSDILTNALKHSFILSVTASHFTKQAGMIRLLTKLYWVFNLWFILIYKSYLLPSKETFSELHSVCAGLHRECVTVVRDVTTAPQYITWCGEDI